jgi:hypothetical protein
MTKAVIATALPLVVIAGNAVGANAASATASNPHGAMSVSLSGARVHVRGTATDPNSSRPVRVVVSISGRRRATVLANRAGHRFRVSLVLRYGRHTVSARAVNIGRGTSDTMLGSRQITRLNPATRNPRGIAHIARTHRVIRIVGHAYDPDRRHRSLYIRTFRNGHRVATTRTNGRTHRYVQRLVLPFGRTHLSVIAYNVGLGTHNPKIRRYAVTLLRPWIASYRGHRRIAARLFARHGWGRAQMPGLDRLWDRESGWSVTAANASGAYGIPQALPGSKMASAGPDWRRNARTQIAWGLNYIDGRYGSPNAAWRHELGTGWY